jgi:two-component system, chemotaxis family, protein-glutamate methylesterase/glutaminase
MGNQMDSLRKIKVLIVDDSAVVRQTLSSMLSTDPMIEVIDTAIDPYFAAKKMQHEAPDVITLDIEMPRMDGLTFLKRIMTQHPVPVVIISSLTVQGADAAIKALEYGAIEIITKPNLNTKKFIEDSRISLCDAVKAAAHAKIKPKVFPPQIAVTPKQSADVILPQGLPNNHFIKTTEQVVAIGASTGGTEALRILLEQMPLNSPGVIIVQHMPENFTKSFANRLNELCKIDVKEAENGDAILRGRALIAPGNKHLLVKRSGAKYYVEVKEGPLVNRHRPSVDVLFRSVARYAGQNAIGVILSGMGDDGARGLLEMKDAGAKTIAQDESTSVVFGMPKEAINLNAVMKVLPLPHITEQIVKWQMP